MTAMMMLGLAGCLYLIGSGGHAFYRVMRSVTERDLTSHQVALYLGAGLFGLGLGLPGVLFILAAWWMP